MQHVFKKVQHETKVIIQDMAGHFKIGTHSLQQGSKRCRWLKVTKTKKLGKKKSESLGWDPPLPKSLEILFFFVFPRFLPSVGYFKETGMNHRQSCQSALGNAVKHLKISSQIMGKLHSQGLPFCIRKPRSIRSG